MTAVIRRSCFLFLVLPALSACTSDGSGVPTTDPAAPAGAVVAIEGDVTARRAAATTSRALALDSSVFADDEVATAAAAQVQIRLHHNDALWTLAGSRSTRVDTSAAWSAPRPSGGDLLLVRDDREDRTRAAARAGSQEGISTGEAALDMSEVATARAISDTKKNVTPASVPPPQKPELPRQSSQATNEKFEDLFGGENDGGSQGDVPREPTGAEGIGGLGLRGSGVGGAGTGETGGIGTLGTKGLGSGNGYGTGSSNSGGKTNALGTVALEKVEATPATETDLVKMVAKRNLSQLRFCIEQGWQINPSAAGTFGVEFIIGPEGTVPTSIMKTARSTFNATVSSCLTAAPKRWHFPKPNGITKVVLTITAAPAESSPEAVESSPMTTGTQSP